MTLRFVPELNNQKQCTTARSNTAIEMNKLCILALVAALTGCVTVVERTPLDITQVPNDCANRTAIIDWLEQNSRIPQRTNESKEDYERSRGQIRSRIWSMRYTCQPV